MAHPVFITWQGTHDDLRATGIGAFGKRWEAYDFGSFTIGIVHADHPNARAGIASLRPDMVVLPGPNGNLKAQHLKHLSRDFPKAKEGDAFRTVLSVVHDKLGADVLDPDAY